jgi:hypothetical protein
LCASRRRGVALATIVTAGLGLAGCGSSGPRQDASEPDGSFPVQVTAATFPANQVLSQHAHMVLRIRNAGGKAIPNLAVTVCPGTCAYPAPAGEGTSLAVFDSNLGSDALDNPSPPVWIVDHPPGPHCGPSCQAGGAGAYATAYPNTWALRSPLAPGRTATFDWAVTAVKAGHFVVAWQVAAGLAGKAKAVLVGGGAPQGRFAVTVSSRPTQAYVNDKGQIVTTR